MIKDVLVNLSVTGDADPAMDYAISVAGAFGAHLSTLVYEYELFIPGMVVSGGEVAALIHAQRRTSEQATVRAHARFETQSRLAGLATDSRKVKATMPDAADHMGAAARVFDLAIIGQPRSDDSAPIELVAELVAEAVLFSSGRPVIVVPYIQKGGLKLNHVTVCWDGSRAAARAIADALPFLKMSKVTELLIVDTKQNKDNELVGADMAQHLARHGVQVEIKRVPSPNVDVANAILSHVADTSSDLLVMGGYGHSRLREFVLGGVTRSVLKEMTLPTFMSH
jgi:nucleotide-binding universal stress UspA family protein